MRNFVQYHNPDKRGKFVPTPHRFLIVTNKTVDNLVGDRIWLLSRRGKPPQYILCETFIVEKVGRGQSGPQRNFAEGSDGRAFIPSVRIDQEPWFERLRGLTGNFRFGLQAVNNEEIVQGLLRAGSET